MQSIQQLPSYFAKLVLSLKKYALELTQKQVIPQR